MAIGWDRENTAEGCKKEKDREAIMVPFNIPSDTCLVFHVAADLMTNHEKRQ